MAQLTADEINRVKSFISRHEWRFAKTMPDNPHWYVVKGKLPTPQDVDDFEHFVMFIREHGTARKYYRAIYTYLTLDDFEYWTMGAPLDITIIINRAKIAA